MYENHTMHGSKDVMDKNTVEDAVKHGTLAMGYIGIAEMCTALFGKNHAESDEALEFAVEVVKRIHDYALEATERNHLNFSCYATPAEGLCSTALEALRKQYGVIRGVTDRDYLTNSHHVPVWVKLSIYDKLKIESRFTKYPTGGCITYVELDSTFMHNLTAIEKIIDFAFKECDIPYLAFNFPIDTCLDCGYQGDINDECPECGSHHIQHLARVTGYLSTDVSNFNKGKRAEVKDRVKHSAYTSAAELQ
jgi:ribonucleoside-triphosphate reductase